MYYEKICTYNFFNCFSDSTRYCSANKPYLVGTNVWYNPSQKVWDLTAECGVKMIRIGGHAYDDNLPFQVHVTKLGEEN